MPRTFDGAGDVLNCSVGACGLTGAFTVVTVLKKASNPASFMNVCTVHNSSGTSTFGLEIEDASAGNNLQVQVGATFRLSTFSVAVADNWVLVAGGKAAGTTTPRVHKYVFDTNAWTHEDASGTAGNPASSAGGTVRFGLWETADDYNGDIAAAAIFDRNLTDAEVEQLAYSFTHWHALGPVGMWILDQSVTTQNVVDLTGGGANQSSLTGTTVSTNSLPILGYGHPVQYLSSSASSGSTDATISASTVAGVGAIGGPTIQAGSAVAASTVAGVGAVGSPTVQAGSVVVASTVAGVGAVGSPTVRLGVLITPAVVAGVGAIGSPTVQAGSVVAATTVAGVGAVGAASVVTLSPPTVAGIGTVGSPTVQAGSQPTPATVAGVGAVGAPTVRLGVLITPAAVAGVGAVGAPTVQAGSVVTATTVAGVGAVGSPSLGGSAIVNATTVAGVGAVGSPTVRAGATPTPTTVAGTGAIPVVTVRAGSVVVASAVVGVGAVGSPTVQAGSQPAPATVVAVGAVGAPSVQAGTAVIAVTVAGVGSVGAPIFPPQPATVAGVGAIGAPVVSAALPGSTTPPAVYRLEPPPQYVPLQSAQYRRVVDQAVTISG